ncbi:GNAT family N-acetyltransferase [Jannaschia pohangensis]|uniref:Acetyltransferase, GNAT family n=1 Tax=Jannaschia pohangensis TaxID=390807 RepID=A0A1I3JHM5_9RHOB|nr:GNAT family N-acetyltransferase [Jannaschia pohangensis]SFI59782.1 Acetyltransferase, GNAT family [Jannaschia pohangensis]
MTDHPTIRATTGADAAAIDALLAVSYPRLLAGDYSADQLARALPLMTRAKPELLASGTYFLIEGADGQAIAAGGWSLAAPGTGETETGLAHVRHVACHPDHLRCGHARRILDNIIRTSRDAWVTDLDCLSTLTAVPFYAAQGFAVIARVDVPIGGRVPFPSVQMRRAI